MKLKLEHRDPTTFRYGKLSHCVIDTCVTASVLPCMTRRDNVKDLVTHLTHFYLEFRFDRGQ